MAINQCYVGHYMLSSYARRFDSWPILTDFLCLLFENLMVTVAKQNLLIKDMNKNKLNQHLHQNNYSHNKTY